MWPTFLKRIFLRKYYRCEDLVKSIYPSKKTGLDYLEYLTVNTNMHTTYVCLLFNVFIDPDDKRSARALRAWACIMRINK